MLSGIEEYFLPCRIISSYIPYQSSSVAISCDRPGTRANFDQKFWGVSSTYIVLINRGGSKVQQNVQLPTVQSLCNAELHNGGTIQAKMDT